MKRFYLLSVLMVMFTISANAQLEVDENGNVAIGTTNSDFKPRLSVGNNSHFSNDNTFSWGLAATPLLQDGKRNVAVEGSIRANESFSSETNVGVFGITRVNPNHGRNFGVVATIDYDYAPVCVGGAGLYAASHGWYLYNPANIQGMYAAYFSGPTNISGRATIQEIYTPADERLNDNVSSVETKKGETTTLDNLLKMDVLEFNMKSREKTVEPKAGEEMTEEVKKSYEQLKKEEKEMYSRRHFGLSAKELEKVYPNLVLKGQDGYQYINYTELVPILVRGIQELKSEVNELKAEVKELKAKCAGVEKTDIDELESEGIQISLK